MPHALSCSAHARLARIHLLIAHTTVGSSRMRPFLVPATPPAGRQDTPAGYHGVKTVSCSGRVVPARLRYAPLEALPPPQVRDSTDTPPMWVCVDRNATTGHAYWKISLRGCTRCDTLATPSPLQVFPSICQGTKCGTPFNLLFHSLVCAELSGPSHAG